MKRSMRPSCWQGMNTQPGPVFQKIPVKCPVPYLTWLFFLFTATSPVSGFTRCIRLQTGQCTDLIEDVVILLLDLVGSIALDAIASSRAAINKSGHSVLLASLSKTFLIQINAALAVCSPRRQHPGPQAGTLAYGTPAIAEGHILDICLSVPKLAARLS